MINKKITAIIKKHIKSQKFNQKTTLKKISKWDSLTHLNILFAIEKFFKIKFTIIEISKFKNIEEIIDSVKKKTK
tara:strand:- start:944 stop:1168 length:225 start_codon:yes stop_codon:yes gene_type:complete